MPAESRQLTQGGIGPRQAEYQIVAVGEFRRQWGRDESVIPASGPHHSAGLRSPKIHGFHVDKPGLRRPDFWASSGLECLSHGLSKIVGTLQVIVQGAPRSA